MAARQSNLYLEDFKPMSEWKEEPENNILLVHLPGFSKEEICIRCIRSSRRIRIQGEQEAEEQIRRRFVQIYEIPENCKIDKIHAKLHDGILYITLPKDRITQVVSNTIYSLQPPETQPQEPLESKDETKPPAKPEDKGRNEVSEFKTPPSIPKREQKQTETQLTHAAERPESSRESQKSEENGRNKPEDKGRNEVSEFETPHSISKQEQKQTETQLTHAAERPKSSRESQKSEEKGRNEVSEFGTLPLSLLKSKQIQTETQTHDAAKSSSSKESQKSEEKDRDEVSGLSPIKKVEEEKKKKEKTTSTSHEKDKESILKKAVDDDGVVANKKEAKQLILNIGVAALAILSVGVYVSYKYGSKLG